MDNGNAKDRVAGLAGRQFGRVSSSQLQRLGVARRTIHNWALGGYLHHELPRVYAVGHRAKSVEGDLAAALLCPGAMLSHATAAWWIGLADSRPRKIEVSTPRRIRSIRGIIVHQRRKLDRAWHKRMPVTSFTQTLLDYATEASRSELRRALAVADYRGILDVAAIESALKRGGPGSAKLRRALENHQPRLAKANSGGEVELLELCEAGGIALPELNAKVAGWTVDALFREERVVVELDGWRNHRSPAQLKRDHQKDLELRAAGFVVLRYSYEQITTQRDQVIAELRKILEERALAA